MEPDIDMVYSVSRRVIGILFKSLESNRAIVVATVSSLPLLAAIATATPAAASREPFTPSLPKTWKAAETGANDAKAKTAPAARGAADAKKPARNTKRRARREGTAERTRRTAGASCGHASWYASGSRTANGERFVPSGLTAAHRTLAFGTRLVVTDPATKKSVTVRVNDRGPFIRGRMLDLSKGAAAQLGVVGRGVAHVCVAVLGKGETTTRAAAGGKAGGKPPGSKPADAAVAASRTERLAAGDAGEGGRSDRSDDVRLIAARSVAVSH